MKNVEIDDNLARHRLLSVLSEYRAAKQKLREIKRSEFEPGLIVAIKVGRSVAQGIIRIEDDSLDDHVAVEFEHGDVWHCPMESIIGYVAPEDYFPWVVWRLKKSKG